MESAPDTSELDSSEAPLDLTRALALGAGLPPGSAYAILARRAQELAELPPVRDTSPVHASVVVVTLGQEQLGIPVSNLVAVLEQFSLTPVIGTPAWHAGLAHVRGELISVVYLSHWLGPQTGTGSRILAVVSEGKNALGLLVDEAIGFRNIHEDELSAVLTQRARQGGRPVSAVTRDLVALLDVEALLADPALVIDMGG